jgi:RNA polymerase sporulation-specific sigma factor
VASLSTKSQGQLQVDDGYLIALAKQGDPTAYDRIVRRYYGFVRLKASSYFLTGGDSDDLIQEGLVGLYKAVRDYRTDRESSFRNFAELCITRQIITAVKTATRNKHMPLNQYVSFSSTPASSVDGEPTLDEILPGPAVHDPVNQVISSEEIQSLVACLSSALSELESRVLSLYLDGNSYEQIGERIGCDTKTVDNALQRVKRKVGAHLLSRNVMN